MKSIPATRIAVKNRAPVRSQGELVLYWMIAARRSSHNFGLQRAADLARELGKPLVVLEALRCGYPWASDRIHRFVLDGMSDHARAFADRPLLYYPYVEGRAGEGKGLIRALAERAAAVVTDDFPCFFLPRMVAAAAEQCPVRLEAVDSNGLFPIRATDRVFTTAKSFRLFLQKNLREHLPHRPRADALGSGDLPGPYRLPRAIEERWPRASQALLDGDPAALAGLPIDHSVGVVPGTRGGDRAAGERLDGFFKKKLARYHTDRNEPVEGAESGLSPYLHFGHLSVHEIFERLVKRERWTEDELAEKAHGSREGWWGMSPEAEAFLDEVVTWREIGLNMCALRDDYQDFDSLPGWAKDTLAAHAKDPRPTIYSLAELEGARTHDEVWNAAQRQLVREGKIQNYLRMLWGKKILEWSPSPEEALRRLVELNNKYALDGRDPNSYAGIFWVLGRYDRAWGPVRPIYGTIRYMSSDSTRRKLHLSPYLERFRA